MARQNVLIARERRDLMDLMGSEPYAIPGRCVDENILIATWNIQAFGNRHSDRAIQYIADICERFDIIAIQEVKTDLRGLGRLQQKLPGNYKILVTDPTGNNERFAFLYDKRTVIQTGLACEIGFDVPGKTHTGFQLHRMPYCVSFRAGRFDFVIVSAHIYYGKGADVKFRKREIKALVDFVHKRSRKERAKVFDRDFFVVGDFNIPDAGSEFFDALVSKGFKMPEDMDSLGTNFAGTKTYDKIAWVQRKSFTLTGKFNTVPFGDVLFQEKKSRGAKKEISDHRPLWAEFKVNKLTQELDQIINRGW